MQNYLHTITTSLSFLQETIERRLQLFFRKDGAEPFSFPEVVLEDINAPLNRFLVHYRVNIEEYLVLLLALVPHVQPNFIDSVIQPYLPDGGDFPEMGGVKGNNHRGTIPTGETALFILAGNDISKRVQVSEYFSTAHFFTKENILSLEQLRDGEPRMSGKIILHPDYIDLFTTGTVSKPNFGPDFPAKNISTKLNWDDLILNPKTALQIQDIKIWLDHNDVLMNDWEMSNKVKAGYRALFYGPSGTGKTLTATLLGKQFQKDVYRIDLSQIVSKYIGETEKNLEKIFDKAEHKDWILFFDEADALFGKRTNVQNAHDKYANQEVSYLLQRVEDFPGLIILASNYKSNIDQAFIRRFNAVIYFPMPNPTERYEIWKTSLPAKAQLSDDIDLKAIANKYELTGSSIVSVIHYAALQTIHKKGTSIEKKDLIEGIKREYEKEEKVFVG